MRKKCIIGITSSAVAAVATLSLYALASCLPEVETSKSRDELEVVQCRQYAAKDVPQGNYSGMTHLWGNRYALVSDKGESGGYYCFEINVDSIGNISSVKHVGYRKLSEKNLDEEAICYDPDHHNIYIGREETSEIVRYDVLNGQCNASVVVDRYRDFGVHNLTIESLAFDRRRLSVFTISEGPLRGDNGLMLRLLEYTPNLNLKHQYTYILDPPLDDSPVNEEGHVFGVSELLSLDDGTLLVLEREFKMALTGVGSWVVNKIFRIRPGEPGKHFVTGWRTTMGSSDNGLANYEGMCLGPRLADGRRVVILCADSQNRYLGILQDWFKTIVINP